MSIDSGVTLVGREAELAVIATALEQPAAGAVLLVGEAGIGKTTVWSAAGEMARTAGRLLLTCRGSAAEAKLSFAALGDLLEPLGAEVRAGLPEAQRRALEAALLIGDPDDGSHDTRAVGLGLLNVLRALVRAHGVVVALDDLQWLDLASAAAIEFAIRRLGPEPLLVLATAREDGLPLDIERALPTRRLRLGPLSLGALHHIIAAELGSPPARLGLRRVHAISGGNPFYAIELFRAIAAGHELDSPALPDSLEALVRTRLDALPVSAHRALFDVAALSEPTAALVDLDALAPAVGAGIVAFAGEELRFTHPLLAAACYGRLPPPVRREAHARLARLPVSLEERARHLALATETPDETVARLLLDAAAEASSRGAPASAAELLERSVALTPASRPRGERMLAAADAHLAAGQWERARTLLRELSGHERPALAAEAAVRLATWVLEDVRRGIELCQAALRACLGDPGLRSRVHAGLCANLHLLGDYGRARVHALEAVREAERAEDRRALAVALGYLGMFEVILAAGKPVEHLEQARALAAGAESLLPVHPGTWLGLWHMYRHELDEARALLETEHDAALQVADDAQRSAVLLHLCELEWRAGDWPGALQRAEEGYHLADQVGDAQGRGALLYARALIAGHLGRIEEAREATTTGLRIAAELEDRVFPSMHALAAGLLEFSLGRHPEALGYFAVLDRMFGAQRLEPAIVPYQADAVEALIALGRFDEAARRLEAYEQRAAELGRDSTLAELARGRAGLLAASGELEAALDSLQRALPVLDRLQAPFPRARALLALGVLHRRCRQRGAAREYLAEAAAIFEKLGAAVWLDRAGAELARISGRRPAAGGALTATERQIAELVVTGRSNKEVAALLSITVRTVESNLTRIYEKLAVRSRTELAHKLLH